MDAKVWEKFIPAVILFFVGLKGGALVSTLFSYAQHGDPESQGLIKHLLDQVISL